MPNKSSAKEWLKKAWHDLSSAQILYDAKHYTDVIGVDLQQACEKSLKSLLAYENKKILKSHNLLEIYEHVNGKIVFEQNEIDCLIIATKYYIVDKYPSMDRPLPSRDEILNILEFSQKLFQTTCNTLDINQNELK
jgi:HEPN domain-containing protein